MGLHAQTWAMPLDLEDDVILDWGRRIGMAEFGNVTNVDVRTVPFAIGEPPNEMPPHKVLLVTYDA